MRLGAVFGFVLVLNLLTGAMAGTLLPLTLQRVGIGPALIGGAVLTAATDIVGFPIVFGFGDVVSALINCQGRNDMSDRINI